jgi:hypothetical protein
VTLLFFLPILSLRLGILGASLSVLIAAIFWYFIVRVMALQRVTGLGFRMIGRALLPSLAASAFMATGILTAKAFATAPTGIGFLVFLVILGGVLYISSIYTLLGRELRLHLGLAASEARS